MRRYTAQIQPDGKFHCDADCMQAMRGFSGEKFLISVEAFAKTRSAKQERFYRGTILPAVRVFECEARDKQFSLDTVHNYIKGAIMGRTEMVEWPDGSWHEEIISNADKRNTTVSWEKEMEMIRAYYAPKGLMLPLPKEIING